MRRFLAAVYAIASATVTAIGATPTIAQVVETQYGGYDRYSRDYDDPYGDDDPYYDRGRYGRDRDYRPYDRGDDRYDDDAGNYGDRYYQGQQRARRGDSDDRQQDVVVKRLTKQDKRCLRKHSTYDPETGTYSDGRGGRKRCSG